MSSSDSADSAAGSNQTTPLAGEEILVALDELSCLTEGLLATTAHQNLVAARVRVAEDRFNLVVLGEFKRGKSTLVNALLDSAGGCWAPAVRRSGPSQSRLRPLAPLRSRRLGRSRCWSPSGRSSCLHVDTGADPPSIRRRP